VPQYHVYAHYIKQGSHGNGAVGFARYMDRSEQQLASQSYRYAGREGEHHKADLVAHGVDHLPAWAQSGAHFWQQADTHERAGYIVARQLEIALPRELSHEARQALADDIRHALLPGFPQSWAIHNPKARDHSGEMPHVHILYSPRKLDGIDRQPEVFFSKAANRGTDASLGGARKDPHLERKAFLREARATVAALSNAALEREGL